MRSARVRRRLAAGAVVLGALLLATALAAAVGLRIVPSPESFSGAKSPATYLADWTPTGTTLSTTPTPASARLSVAVGTPTRLPAAATAYLVTAGTAGDTALAWTFTEAVGIPVDLEVELAFTVHWTHAGTAEASSVAVYVETQAAAIRAPITFTLYFDAAAATGVVFASQYELSQACGAVGACP